MEITLLFLPLIASIISGFFGKYIGDRNSEVITSLFVIASAILSVFIFYNVIINGYENIIIIASWINSGTLNVNWSIKIDALSSVMLVVVTLYLLCSYIFNRLHVSHPTTLVHGVFVFIYFGQVNLGNC